MNEEMVKFTAKDKFATYLGIKPIKIEDGYALVELELNENHLNGENIMHGGAIFTLADFAFAAATNLYGQITLSTNANITYFKSPTSKIIRAEARELASSRKLTHYCINIFEKEDELIASVTISGYKKSGKVVLG